MFCVLPEGNQLGSRDWEDGAEDGSSSQPFFIKLDIEEAKPVAPRPRLAPLVKRVRPAPAEASVAASSSSSSASSPSSPQTAVLKELSAVAHLEFPATRVGCSASLELRIENPTKQALSVVAANLDKLEGLSVSPREIQLAPLSGAVVTVQFSPSKSFARTSGFFDLKWKSQRNTRVKITYTGLEGEMPVKTAKPVSSAASSTTTSSTTTTAIKVKPTLKPTATTTTTSTVSIKRKPLSSLTVAKKHAENLPSQSQSAKLHALTTSSSRTSSKATTRATAAPPATAPAAAPTPAKNSRSAFHTTLSRYVAESLRQPPAVDHTSLLQSLLTESDTTMLGRLESRVRNSKSTAVCLRDDVDVQEPQLQRDLLVFLFECYQLDYLRAALEIIFAQPVVSQDSAKDVKSQLTRFIRHRVLFSASLQQSFASSSSSSSSSKDSEEQFRQAMKRYALYKTLLVIWLADEAKSLCLLPADPPLFLASSKVKSSLDLVTSLAQRWFPGDHRRVLRELQELGYSPRHVQRPIDELALSTTADQQIDSFDDGAAVARWTVAMYHNCWFYLSQCPSSFSSIDRSALRMLKSKLEQAREFAGKMRCPATLPLHRSANVKVVLDFLTESAGGSSRASIENRELSKRVSNKDRLAIVDLVWRVVSEHYLSSLLTVFEAAITSEIAFQLNTREINLTSSRGGQDSSSSSASSALLLRWCQAISTRYSIALADLSSTHVTGTMLCVLVHHYHHHLLPYSSIDFSPSPKAHQRNVAVFADAAQQLGGIPDCLLNEALSVMPMDDRTAFLLMSHLCLRLLHDAPVNRAATLIQMTWLRHRTRLLCRERTAAVLVLQARYRGMVARQRFLALRDAAVVAQSHLRGALARRRFLQMREAAIKLQAFARCQAAQRRFLELKAAATRIQSYWRMRQQQCAYQRLRAAAIVLQAQRRQVVERRAFLEQKAAAVLIQAQFRGFVQRRHFRHELRPAAIKIQKAFRGYAARKRYEQLREAAIVVQARVRGAIQRRRYLRERELIVKTQANARRFLEVRRYQKARASAVKIQACVRGWQARKEFLRQKENAVRIQAWYRQVSARRRYLAMREAAVRIQAAVRMQQQRGRFLEQKQAAVAIQTAFRRHQARRDFLQQKQAAIAIQTAVRRHQARAAFLRQKEAAVRIQAVVRRHQAQQAYQQQKAAALTIQTATRRFLARVAFLRQRQAAISIQTAVRRHQARKAFLQQKQAATTIQAAFRMHAARSRFQAEKSAATKSAACVRMRQQRSRYLKQRAAAITIQTALRKHQARQSYLQMKAAAVAIQTAVRRHQAQQEYLRQREAAIRIQAAVRMFQARQRYVRQRQAATKIQQLVRHYQRRKHAATKLQACWRGAVVRRELARQHAAAARIQAAFRGARQRCEFTRTCAAIVIQRAFRASRRT